MFDLVGLIFAVPVPKFASKALRHRLAPMIKARAHLGIAPFLSGRVIGHQAFVAVGTTFSKLRYQHAKGIELLLDNRVNRNGYVGLERIGLLKPVRVVEEYGILL